MAEIGNDTMNFGCGRPAGFTFAVLTLASAEIHGDPAGNAGAKEI